MAMLSRMLDRGRGMARRFLPFLRPKPQLRMVIRLDDAPGVPPLDAPYRYVPYAPELKTQWAALLTASGEFGTWDVPRLEREIVTYAIDGGIGLIGDARGLVACAAACALPHLLPEATLMYVVALAGHRGKGLGAAVTRAVMAAARCAGFARMVLYTDDARLAALHSYWSVGFRPWLSGGEERRWDDVRRRLGVAGGGAS